LEGRIKVITGFIIGIALAFILSLVHFDATIIAGVKDLIRIDIGQSGYYLLLGIVGGISRVMIGGFITGLVVAYIFTFIKLDHFVIHGLKELFKYDLTTGGYYLSFAIIGAGMSFLKVVRMFLRPFLFMLGGKDKKAN
jgi:hypothetical protein